MPECDCVIFGEVQNWVVPQAIWADSLMFVRTSVPERDCVIFNVAQNPSQFMETERDNFIFDCIKKNKTNIIKYIAIAVICWYNVITDNNIRIWAELIMQDDKGQLCVSKFSFL